MGAEEVALRGRDGTLVTGQAEITRYSTGARLVRSVPIAVTGIVVGAFSILIPAVHLISTWLLPLLGIAFAFFVWRTRVVVGEVRGPCPRCDEAMVIDKPGAWHDREALWVRCPHCELPLELKLPDA